jgi:hypothetical protein
LNKDNLISLEVSLKEKGYDGEIIVTTKVTAAQDKQKGK